MVGRLVTKARLFMRPLFGSMNSKDWASLMIAVLALAISATTAYFNLLRDRDDVRVAFGFGPTIFYNKTAEKLHLADPTTLTFINSGNRAAAIANVAQYIDGRHAMIIV